MSYSRKEKNYENAIFRIRSERSQKQEKSIKTRSWVCHTSLTLCFSFLRPLWLRGINCDHALSSVTFCFVSNADTCGRRERSLAEMQGATVPSGCKAALRNHVTLRPLSSVNAPWMVWVPAILSVSASLHASSYCQLLLLQLGPALGSGLTSQPSKPSEFCPALTCWTPSLRWGLTMATNDAWSKLVFPFLVKYLPIYA